MFAYIDVLSVYPVVILLDNDYRGPILSMAYEHNVISNTERIPEIVKEINREKLLSIINAGAPDCSIAAARFNRVVEFYCRANNLPLEQRKFV